MKEFFETLNDHTRATYYVLPLISLNKFSFGQPENFENAFVTSDGKRVIVKLKSKDLVYPKTLLNSDYLEDTKPNQLTFTIPEKFWTDVQKFIKGKYSKLSPAAKDMIRLNSGLNYRLERTVNGIHKLDTDARLKALDREEDFRKGLERMLNINLSEDDELISPPNSNEILDE